MLDIYKKTLLELFQESTIFQNLIKAEIESIYKNISILDQLQKNKNFSDCLLQKILNGIPQDILDKQVPLSA